MAKAKLTAFVFASMVAALSHGAAHAAYTGTVTQSWIWPTSGQQCVWVVLSDNSWHAYPLPYESNGSTVNVASVDIDKKVTLGQIGQTVQLDDTYNSGSPCGSNTIGWIGVYTP